LHYLKSDIEVSRLRAATLHFGVQARKAAKAQRKKKNWNKMIPKMLKCFHRQGEFSYLNFLKTNLAALRLCVRLNRVSAISSSLPNVADRNG